MQQHKITQYANSKYEADPGMGDPITAQKALKDIRLYLQNPNGVMNKDTKLDDRRALLSLREWGVDILALPETNKNWKKEYLRNKWKAEVQRVWRHSKVFFTSIDEPADPSADHLQGGGVSHSDRCVGQPGHGAWQRLSWALGMGHPTWETTRADNGGDSISSQPWLHSVWSGYGVGATTDKTTGNSQ